MSLFLLVQTKACLDAITACCKSSDGNLLALAIDASRARATVGEITSAMEKVYGRHVATSRLVSGAYKTEYGDSSEIAKVMERIKVCCDINIIYLFICIHFYYIYLFILFINTSI